MKSLCRRVLLGMAIATVSLLAGADNVAPSVPPASPGMSASAPVLGGAASSPAQTGEIVAPTFPNWLPPVHLAQTPPPAQHHDPVNLAVASRDAPVATGAGNISVERIVFAIEPRVWVSSPDLSKPYLMWPGQQPDGARANLTSDPTSPWSAADALHAGVLLRNSAVPYIRFSIPVPVEPGSTIQSVPTAREEPLPLQTAELLGTYPKLP